MQSLRKGVFTSVSALLVFGDVLVFILFALYGRIHHDLDLNVDSVIRSAWPFIVAWLAVGKIVGAYAKKAVASIPASIKWVIYAWIPAGFVGLALRSLFDRSIPNVDFMLVTVFFLLLMLIIWRILFTFLHNKNKNRQQR